MSSKFRKTFTFNGIKYQVYGKTKSEVEEKLLEKKTALKQGLISHESELTIKEWGEKATLLYKTNQSDETKERYIGVMRSSIFKEIGHIKLKNATPVLLQECLNRQEGRSKDHIARVCQQIKFIFSTAQKNGLINIDPSLNLTKPKGTNNKRRTITSEERKIFLEVAHKPLYFPFLFMYYCGLRPNETRKITSEDISMVDGKPLLHVRGTKTSHADRYVPVPEQLVEMINKTPKIEKYCVIKKYEYTKRFNKLRDEMRDKLGGQYIWEKVTPTGKDPYYKKVYENDPLAKDFTSYCLRHTFCTDLRDKGIDIRDAQYLMGHANISITANIYTHSDKSTALKVASII